MLHVKASGRVNLNSKPQWDFLQDSISGVRDEKEGKGALIDAAGFLGLKTK